MKEIEKFKKAILEEYPRMDLDSEFSFKCHPGVTCFNQCCADVNIFLTPYDIIRLKKRLGITSGEFLSKYTLMPFDENSKFPVILFEMQENEKKCCHFVGEKGCTVYEDRPWACRMYPLGMASPSDDPNNTEKEFYFLLKEDVCHGHKEDNKMTVSDWVKDQGIEQYNEMGEHFKEVTLHPFLQNEENSLNPAQVDMFFTACYNIDKFRDFIFKSSFLDKFEIEEGLIEKIKNDDVEMLMFGYRFIKFSLFGEPTLQIKTNVAEAKEAELKKKKKI
ncbi:MAG: YkgJ family cysteine cluster protein [candidate division Zixibacteria bacterium]|nr:YkgJ family cysteine cluster protein [candidate division Zixibacteria bacterium]